MKESFKKKLVRSIGWNGPDIWKELWEMKNWQSRCPALGVTEDRECDSRTALREIWKEWEEN